MGILINKKTGGRVVLRSQHVVGRNALRSDTLLSDPDISLLHALLRWQDRHWFIADYGRNGTFLDGRQLVKGQWTLLSANQHLRFGVSPRNLWYVADVAAPVTALIPLDTDDGLIELASSNLLPNEETPEMALYQTAAAQWRLETPDEVRVLDDGDTLCLSGKTYQLSIPYLVDETQPSARYAPETLPYLNFVLSLDEEHTRMMLQYGSESVDLGVREHHYCLVTLARKRLRDMQLNLDISAQGWIDCAELAKSLGIDPTHLNIQIFRARNQLLKVSPDHSNHLANIVERRRGSIRLGAFAFDIMRGSVIEGHYEPAPALGILGHE